MSNPFEPEIVLYHKYNREAVKKRVHFIVNEDRELGIEILNDKNNTYEYLVLSYDDHHALAEFLKENDVWK